jgi:hypothetical protein
MPKTRRTTVLNIEPLEIVETVTMSVTIPKPTRDQVGLYARLVNRTMSDVIGIMLERFMERDKEFQKQLSQQPALATARAPATKRAMAKAGSDAGPESV